MRWQEVKDPIDLEPGSDLMLLRLDPGLSDRVEKPEAVKARLVEQASRFPVQDLLHLTQRAAEGYARLERARFDEAKSRIVDIQHRMDQLATRPAHDPEVRRLERRLMAEMMQVQLLAQHAQFGVELTSKVVEHGTGGGRVGI